ncbi:MAG: chemotaxis protein CheW, partial [Deltaproteobacteria bacterium]|nr:chemotaxis protein CheW [Deltaproteobacteria bacterium]
MGDIITQSNQYLTFKLGQENFALDISRVREVLDYIHITKVPRTPD